MPLGHAKIFVAAAVRALAQNKNCADEISVVLRGSHLYAGFKNARVAMAGPIAMDALMCGKPKIVLRALMGQTYYGLWWKNFTIAEAWRLM